MSHSPPAPTWMARSTSKLPLYKDKPRAGTLKETVTRLKKLRMLLNGFLLSVAVFTVYKVFGPQALSSVVSWQDAQNEVKQAFVDSWHAYEKNAWGFDVYHPISQTGENMGSQPLGWMIVDSVDTMMLMGLTEETARAREWIKKELTYDFDYNVNVFETTIRMLGGLLSAFYLSKDDVYLDKAADLANRLLGGFESPSGIPFASVNLQTGKGIKNHVDAGASSTAEVATLQLEFKYLAKLTGETLYWNKVEKIIEVLERNQPEAGLAPIYVDPDSGTYKGNLIRLGSRGDSYYEYLLKQYIQTGEPVYRAMYDEAMAGVKTHMTRTSHPNGLTFIGELDRGIGGGLSSKMDHLVCFMGGLLALGATEGQTLDEARRLSLWTPTREADFRLAVELTHTCYKMYHDVLSGLAPEIVVFNTDAQGKADFHIKPLDRLNLQRPETVESLFVLYRLTRDPIYREWGWEIFQAFQKNSRLVLADGEVTYTLLKDVVSSPVVREDNMESFWLAETLKYLYLLFDDEEKMPLDQVVFNTEAHPFPRFELGTFKTGWTRSPVQSSEKKDTPKPQDVAPMGDANDRAAVKRPAKRPARSQGFVADTEKSVKEQQKKDGAKPGVAAPAPAAKQPVGSVPKAAVPAKPVDQAAREVIEAKRGEAVAPPKPVSDQK